MKTDNKSSKTFAIKRAAAYSKLAQHNRQTQENKEDYGINDLCSENETDDEEKPKKPIPDWASERNVLRTVKHQTTNKMINFTKLFKSCSQSNVVLEEIFKVKKTKFSQRSSSADWQSPPFNGLNGNESFRRIKEAI
jgi:hypothetical protein